MGLFDYFRRPPPITTFSQFVDFLDSRTAFLVQKTVYEYCRARSGVLWSKLFKEASFIAALDKCRWLNYPLGLSQLLQMVEGTLREDAAGREERLIEGLLAAAETVTGRYPVPPGFERGFWRVSRNRIADRLAHARLAPPRDVKDIPTDTAREFFDNLPIHETLRVHDFALIRNHLRSNLCRLHEEFLERVERPAIVDVLIGGGERKAGPGSEHGKG